MQQGITSDDAKTHLAARMSAMREERDEARANADLYKNIALELLGGVDEERLAELTKRLT